MLTLITAHNKHFAVCTLLLPTILIRIYLHDPNLGEPPLKILNLHNHQGLANLHKLIHPPGLLAPLLYFVGVLIKFNVAYFNI